MFKNVNNELKCQGLHIKMQYAIHKYAPGKEFDLFPLHANTKPLRILINGLVLFSFLTIKPALVFEDCWFGNYEIYSPPNPSTPLPSPMKRTNECPDPLDRISWLTTKIKQRKDWNHLFFKCQHQILKLFLQAIEGSGKLRKADVNNYRSIRLSVSFLISFFPISYF